MVLNYLYSVYDNISESADFKERIVGLRRNIMCRTVRQPNILVSLVSFLLQLPSRTGLNRELKLEVLKEAAQLGTIHILRYHF